MPFTDQGNGTQIQTGNTFFQSANNNTLGTFIPEIWSSQLFVDLESALILSGGLISNRQYEGEIRNQGDTVRIPHFLDKASVGEGYDPYSEIGEANRAESDSLLIRIDQARTIHFEVDDLHQLQTSQGLNLMQNLTSTHARALAESMDRHVAATVKAAINGLDHNFGDGTLHGSVKMITPPANGAEIYSKVIEARTILDINNVPENGRYLLIGPAEYAMILLDPNFIDASKYGAGSVLVNGEVGRIAGMTVILSNTIGSHLTDAQYADLPGVAGAYGVRKPNSGGHDIHMIVGHSMALSTIGSLTRLEAYRPEKKFTNAVKGLYVFGSKLMRPEAMVVVGTVPAPSP
ncbi:phage capsid protein [Nocardiopsis sp. NPDC049922]|uniref:phage capsid protein n=1 Tax=Nocardiopsis sp. NPDC049922 TaxID=3155157 RepID=UPI003401A7E3